MAADQFDTVAGRRDEVPDAVFATRIVVGPVRAGHFAGWFRHLVLTSTCSTHTTRHQGRMQGGCPPPPMAAR